MQRQVPPTIAIVLAVVVFVQVFAARPPADRKPEPTQVMVLKTDTKASEGFASDETVIERDGSGQFHLQARVNGQDTEFLVDTGADIVALTQADAERLGIDVAPDDFRPIMETASGVGNAAPVRLDRLELGDDEFQDVGAVVVQGLGVNLLGQSVLRRLGRVEMQGDRMVIEHR